MATLSNAMKSFRTAAVVGAGALMACASQPAMALETGCQNADAVRTALRDEGQFVLVNGVRPIPERPRNIFTSNADGSLGYKIEEGTNNVLCVTVRYTDVRVNRNPDLALPSWARRGEGTAHDRWLADTAARTNERVLLGATVLRRDENGQEVRGAFMMVTRGNAGEDSAYSSAGAVTVTLASGEIRPTLVLGNVERVQPNYDQFAQRPVAVAALSR